MTSYKNPFEYEQATTLAPQFIADVFIEDHNFTRFIQSNRNVFLLGERGSGKSMTLLYNSIAVQRLRANNGKASDLNFIGIYIPCNTTLTHKREYELIEDQVLAALISEHFMVLGIAYAIAQGMTWLPEDVSIGDDVQLREDLIYVLGADLQPEQSLMRALMLYIQRESRRSQSALNSLRLEEFRQSAFTFTSLVHPLLHALRRSLPLSNAHFLLLIDDAHDLNMHQKAALNSWIAYRDRSVFSFKVAVADAIGYDYRTASRGVILEGHDFLSIDLQKPFQNPLSDFGKLAKDVIERRLKNISVATTSEEFFPASDEFRKDLDRCRDEIQKEAAIRYPSEADAKKRKDYIYKYSRVKYFRERARRANLPPYSGFDTICHVSTGVIRNLLMPCYWMYDAVYSGLGDDARGKPISNIPPSIQSLVLRERSESLWQWIASSLATSIDNCTLEDSKRIYQLLDNLGELFRKRLLVARSEPRALAFSISGLTNDYELVIMPLLHIARRAQLLYFRSGPAKDEGRRETFYVPNRMLWPIRGLDVVGQHARVSLKAHDVWAAANGVPFPFEETAQATTIQGGLFDPED
ncbi:MAG TPA: hypothetical protein VGJ30_13000 [Candidatus Angelobacter sp.]|jgi:hypothetical protein